MCGITGWVSYRLDLLQHRNVIDTMTRTMARRGPDDSGRWLTKRAALGHRRLSVIDLPGGRQPVRVATPAGEIAMVHSGEVYNYTELRDELRIRGHKFSTKSDTEVVLKGYLEWGQGVAEHLNGMYAFAVWDDRSGTLDMIRDRLGIKPLYYYPTCDGVIFASEAKAIFANPQTNRVVDLEGLREMFSRVKTPGRTSWKNVYEVEPGTVTTVTESGITSRRYWKLETIGHGDDREATVECVRSLLQDTVRRQLVADVPRCVLLSGGLDSSTITALCASQLRSQGEELQTVSVDFFGQEKNFKPIPQWETPDSPYVRDVVRHVGSKHRDMVLDAHSLANREVRRATVEARDSTDAWGDQDASLYLLCTAIRSDTTVALSGEAADEIFAGYHWFHDDKIRRAQTFPWLPEGDSVEEDVCYLRADVRNELKLDEFIADEFKEAISGVEFAEQDSSLDRQARAMSYICLTRNLRILLDRKDRMSMAAGLEVRVPFCDHRLVEYVYNVPWDIKNFDGREKSILRGAASDFLPQSVIARKKSPYPAIQDSGYARLLTQNAQELLSEPGNPVFSLVDRDWLAKTISYRAALDHRRIRSFIERILDLREWFEICKPSLELA